MSHCQPCATNFVWSWHVHVDVVVVDKLSLLPGVAFQLPQRPKKTSMRPRR